MGKKKQSNKASGVVDISALLDGSSESSSGISVNINRALRVTTVLACARVLAEGTAQVPLKLFKRRKNGSGADEAVDEALYDLITVRPNDWMTPFEWREQMMFHAVLGVGGYSFVNRGSQGKIYELLPLVPGAVSVKQSKEWAVTYDVSMGNDVDSVGIPKEDMWHLRGPSWNGFSGLDVIKEARDAIGLSIATETAQSKLMNNGARPGGVLSTDLTLTDPQIKRIRDSWQIAFSGGNQFKTALLDAGMKWAPMTMTAVDAQGIETRKFQIEEICRGMRVFPQMIGHTDKTATYASAEQFFLAHVIHSLMPWFTRFEQVMNRDLLTIEQRKAGFYFKHNVAGLMRGDSKARADYYMRMFQTGSMSPNDIRDLEDMNPRELGDRYYVPANFRDPTEPVVEAPPPVADPIKEDDNADK